MVVDDNFRDQADDMNNQNPVSDHGAEQRFFQEKVSFCSQNVGHYHRGEWNSGQGEPHLSERIFDSKLGEVDEWRNAHDSVSIEIWHLFVEVVVESSE
jgi:hypothetical protein